MSCKAEICPCQNKECPRFGKCCECVLAHKQAGVLPACLKELGKEK